MTLEISLTHEAEMRLRERAAAAGKHPAEFVQALVERDLRRPTLEEISGPVYEEFLPRRKWSEYPVIGIIAVFWHVFEHFYGYSARPPNSGTE